MRGERSASTATAARGKQAGPPPRVTQPESAAREEPLLDVQQQIGNREMTRLLGSSASGASGGADASGGEGASAEATRPETAEDRAARAGADEEREQAAAPAFTAIVEDEAKDVASAQMRKSEFLEALRVSICSSADEGMAGTGYTSMGCPYIGYWIAEYQGKSVAHLERAIRKFAPEAAGAPSASKMIALVTARVRRSVDQWARTGEITGLPEAVPAMLPGAGMFGGVFFKARPGGAHVPSGGAHAIRTQLGPGRALDGQVRGRMEQAFGVSFARVRLHTGVAAARLSEQMNAHAFTVGRDVAFGAGRYHPGNPIGDALIAHELAHVVQQRSAPEAAAAHANANATANARAGDQTPRQETAPLEADANRSAVGAVARLWSGTKSGLASLRTQAGPRLRSGLTLSRCSGCGKKEATKPGKELGTKEDADSKKTGAEGTPKVECKIDPAIEKEKTAIIGELHFGAVQDGDACWTLAELQKVRRNLQGVPGAHRSSFEGVTLLRVKAVQASTCKDADPSGCFQTDIAGDVQKDRLEIPDKYFTDDANATGFLPSTETSLHEAGHAFETELMRRNALAVGKAIKAKVEPDKKLADAITQWNATSIASPELPWKNGAERTYVQAVIAAGETLKSVIDPVNELDAKGTGRSASDIETAARTVKTRVSTSRTRIAARNAARKKIAGSAAINATVESNQDANFAASEALQKALEDAAAAAKTLEKAQTAFGGSVVNLELTPGTTAKVSRRLAELVALVNIRGVNVAKSSLSTHATLNWPRRPAELYATLYQLSLSHPASVTAFDAEVGRFFTSPIGPKGAFVKQINKWITDHTAAP